MISADAINLSIVRAILAKRIPGVPVMAFGSRARGEPCKPWSDLDLALMSDQPLPPSFIMELRMDFSESDLPWRVDLLDWASTDEAFRKRISPELVPLEN
jgi:predicted nucleotidyltransferase